MNYKVFKILYNLRIPAYKKRSLKRGLSYKLVKLMKSPINNKKRKIN